MSAPVTQQLTYTFGDFVLDTRRGAVLTNGKEVRLRRQSFEVLNVLIARHGSLVTKDELHHEVWRNKVVTDDSLAHCLIDIRKALGDTNRQMIRTVPRRGYIFDADVAVGELEPVVGRPAETSWSSSKVLIAAIGAAAAVFILWWWLDAASERSISTPPHRSIAVLPFDDMSAAQDLQYLGDGLSEDILNTLAQYPELRVIARTSSFSLARQSLDIATIRDSLNVAYVLEGSVRRERDRLIIAAQLIDTDDSSHVWSHEFELRQSELFIIQQDIAERILNQILPDSERAIAAPVVRNVSAKESMLLARYYEHEVREQPEVDEEVLAEAIRLYRNATEIDPESALAYSRLAGALLYGGDQRAAEAPIFRALTLDPEISEVQETLGKYYWLRSLPGAGAAWKRALELNPNNPDALNSYGYWVWLQGNSEIPEDFFRRALELDPLSLSRFAALGNFYAQEARIGDAQRIMDRVEQLFDNPTAYRLIARMLELIGRVDESIAWIIRARDLEPDNTDHNSALAELYADIGDFETALRLEPEPGIGLFLKMRRYQDAIDLGEALMIEEPGDTYLRYWLAFAYNVTGNPANAVRILKTTGLPESVVPELRQSNDVEAFVTFVDALDAEGDTGRSHELAGWWIERKHTENANWWIQLYVACPLAIVGRHDEALMRVDKIADSPRLPWNFLLKDSRCFQQYANEPRFKAVLEVVESRQSELRSRVPTTLNEYGVVL